MEAPTSIGFLDEHFKTREDLSTAPSLAAQLTRQCRDLERDLFNLTEKLSAAAASWDTRSDEIAAILRGIRSSRDRDAAFRSPRSFERIIGKELALLAKEVGRVETVRLYAETTLQLEVLVGDLEDAAFSIMNETSGKNLSPGPSKGSSLTNNGWKEEKVMLSVKVMKDIEKVLISAANCRPSWIHLFRAVDSRVDNILSVLRPKALTDHRALLASLGWPPSLLKSNLEKDKCSEFLNPLILMQGVKKEKYSSSFLALCALQQLQAQREARQGLSRCQHRYSVSNLTRVDEQACFSSSLWTIDELVYPIASRMECHFSRWSDQPDFIFLLVYKITRDIMDGVDGTLQPLIDQGRLVGYSAKEAWVSAMVKVLSEYLTNSVFPVLVKRYGARDGNMEVTSLWLHLVDLMITFNKRMKVLVTSGSLPMGPFAEFDGPLPSLSVFSIFNEHLDWLQIWAEIELQDGIEKLNFDLDSESSWSIGIRDAKSLYQEETESFLLSTREDYKAPLITDSVIKISWAMIERGRLLPYKSMRIQFMRSSLSLFLKKFIHILHKSCQELEFAVTIIDDNMLIRVAASVNAAQYCESVLLEWSEDVDLLELTITEHNFLGKKGNEPQSNSSFFESEITDLVKLETDYLVEIVSALMLQFESLCWDYIQNIEQWEAKLLSRDQIMDEENPCITPEFVEALDMLKDRIRILKLNLNSKDFMDLWRSIADGLDHFIFGSIPLGDVKFSCWGANQFKVDTSALFLIFRPFCARPDAFFPRTSDSLKLLTMSEKDIEHLLVVREKGSKKMEERLRLLGLCHVSAGHAEKILRNMNFRSLS